MRPWHAPELHWSAGRQVEGQSDEDLAFLLAHDSDPFCRWEAGQRLLRGLLTSLYTAASASKASCRAPPCVLYQDLLFVWTLSESGACGGWGCLNQSVGAILFFARAAEL